MTHRSKKFVLILEQGIDKHDRTLHPRLLMLRGAECGGPMSREHKEQEDADMALALVLQAEWEEEERRIQQQRHAASAVYDTSPAAVAGDVAHHSCVGLVLAYAPIFVSAVWLSRFTCRKDDRMDEELMVSRPREVLGAAQATRLQALKSRKAKTQAAEDQSHQTSGHECAHPAHGAACVIMNNSRSLCTESAGEAEVCAVCQMNFEALAEVLACRHCDSGFHVRCLTGDY